MIRLKTKEEIEALKEGGAKLARILAELKAFVAPGVTTNELNDKAGELFKASGGTAAFYKYQPRGSERGFPSYVCVSVNEVIVHGIPTEQGYAFKEGDVVTVDGGMKYRDLITDSAVTFVVGVATDEQRKLLEATKESMHAGIKAAVVGAHVGDIGAAVQAVAERNGLELAQNLAGHGVGYEVHEDPFVPNEGKKGEGEILKEGLVIAIEPMLTLGGGEVDFSDDQFTVTTKDGSLSAHFEHTIAVTAEGPVILTKG